MGDDRPSVYIEQDLFMDGEYTVWRASSVGRCKAELYYHLKGVTGAAPPDYMQAAWDAGNAAEDKLLEVLFEKAEATEVPADEAKAMGLMVQSHTGQVEAHLVWGRNVIRCHPDGLVHTPGGLAVAEVKFVGDALWAKFKNDLNDAPEYYRQQAAIEMMSVSEAIGMDIPLLYGVGLKEFTGDGDDRELVLDEDGTPKIADFKWFIVDTPPYTFGYFKKRMAEVLQLYRTGEAPMCDIAQFPCTFWRKHDITNPESVHYRPKEKELKGAGAKEFDEVAGWYLRCKEEESEWAKRKKKALAAWKELAARLAANNKDRYSTKKYAATQVKQTRETFQWNQWMEARGIDPPTAQDRETFVKETSVEYPQVSRNDKKPSEA